MADPRGLLCAASCKSNRYGAPACGGPVWADCINSCVAGLSLVNRYCRKCPAPCTTLPFDLLACKMPRAKAEDKPCLGCKGLVHKRDGRRAYVAQLCHRCWPKHLMQAKVVSNYNLEQGRTSQATVSQAMLCSAVRACQSRKKQWRVKTVRKGRYSTPRRILLCKVTHHVGSSLHIPCKQGGRVHRSATATLALCQLMARQQAAKIDPAGAWMLVIGAAAVDKKYTAEFRHQPVVWRDHVAGRLLAAARIDQLTEPKAAKAKFARHRADTGVLQHILSCLPLHCPALLASGMLAARTGKEVCTWPGRYAPQTRLRTLKAPVMSSQVYSQLALSEVVQARLPFCADACPTHCQELPKADTVLVQQLRGRPTSTVLDTGKELQAARSAVKSLMCW